VTISGSCPPYDISWNTGETNSWVVACITPDCTDPLEDIRKDYIVTITDDNECVSNDTVAVTWVAPVNQLDAYAVLAVGNCPSQNSSSSGSQSSGSGSGSSGGGYTKLVKIGKNNTISGAVGTQLGTGEVHLKQGGNSISCWIAAGSLRDDNGSGSDDGSSSTADTNSIGHIYTGEDYPQDSLVELPPICYCGLGQPQSSGSNECDIKIKGENGSGSGSDDGSSSAAEDTVVLSPGCYCKLDIDKANVILEPGVYVVEKLHIRKNSIVWSATGNASDVVIYAEKDAHIHNNNDVKANIVAARKVHVGKDNQIAGSLIGCKVDIGDNNIITEESYECWNEVGCPSEKIWWADYKSEESIESSANEITFNAYPNPYMSGDIHISLTGVEGESVVMVLYDIMGRVVYSKEVIEKQNGGFFLTINPSGKLAAGIYLIVAGGKENEIVRKKLVVN